VKDWQSGILCVLAVGEKGPFAAFRTSYGPLSWPKLRRRAHLWISVVAAGKKGRYDSVVGDNGSAMTGCRHSNHWIECWTSCRKIFGRIGGRRGSVRRLG